MNARGFSKILTENRNARVGLILVLIPIIMASFAQWIAPYSAHALTCRPYEGPSPTHLLGCDDIGHDLLSQLIYGSRVPLLVGCLSAAIVTTLGTMIAIYPGYIGGLLDEILMRLTDAVMTVPYLVFLIVLTAYLGPNIWNIIMSIGFLGWPSTTRIVRSQVITLKTRLYVEAAVAAGAGRRYIMFNYILPGLLPAIIPLAVLSVMDGILTEAGLSFLGLGDSAQVSWGMILFYAQFRGGFVAGAWWWIVPPGIMITITSLGILFVSHALDEIMNPSKVRT